MATDELTIFDRILNKEIPADVVYEDEHVLSFRDISPQAPVHVLVIPKFKVRNVTTLGDLDAEKIGLYMQGVSKTAKALNLAEDGYRVVFNTGRHGGQTVEYIHAHILGGRSMVWPPG